MKILNPGENFPLSYLIKDHTDTNTYYVQSVIRDATTDTVLATVNLEDKGNRRFVKLWKVVWDNVYSQGKFITITTTVYTDSGYTTKSLNHYEEFDQYLVQQRWNQLLGGGGYSGNSSVSIDYKEIEKIVKKLLDEREVKHPVILKQDFPIDQIIKEVGKQIEKIEIPEQEEIDLSGLESLTNKVILELKTIPRVFPKQKETDLSPVLNKLDEIKPILNKAIDETQNKQEDILEYFKENQGQFVSSLTELVAEKVIEKIKEMEMNKKQETKNKFLNELKRKYV